MIELKLTIEQAAALKELLQCEFYEFGFTENELDAIYSIEPMIKLPK